MEDKLIAVAGQIFDNAHDAAREISALSHRKVTEEQVSLHLRDPGSRLYGIPVSYLLPQKQQARQEWAEPVKTGVPLAIRVWREWLRWAHSETGGYPRNAPSRKRLLQFNPYTVRYGGES